MPCNLGLADPQHGFDGMAVLGIGNGLVDVSEVVERDDPVKRKPPCMVQPDQVRDKMLGHGVALDDAKVRIFHPSTSSAPILYGENVWPPSKRIQIDSTS